MANKPIAEWWDGSAPPDANLPVTERVNPNSRQIDALPTAEIVRLMNAEDATVPLAVEKALPAITAFIEGIPERLRAGGRLIYVGAGTSGRLGVLDASEMPPTFGVPHELVQGVIAGGPAAVFRACEGAEDDAAAGVAALHKLQVGMADVVLGLSASGNARFVCSALQAARWCGAWTGGLTCNPSAKLLDVVRCGIVVEVGPEVIAGSSRLKAGTAQKLVLNMISTTVMIRLGRVEGNRMVDLTPSCEKLRLRATRLVMEALGVTAAEAKTMLAAHGWSARAAIEQRRAG
ncbi:MAG TPA: N-acetylmuramic acid 6-phosphate etherase [Planctomycetota bacterium]|nr:N-acetylmuramic acid 6-phosphate etherase [Planctomycetota bacterium]